jgi:hypothetical protein
LTTASAGKEQTTVPKTFSILNTLQKEDIPDNRFLEQPL